MMKKKKGIIMSVASVGYWWKKYNLLTEEKRLAISTQKDFPADIKVRVESATPSMVTLEEQFISPTDELVIKPVIQETIPKKVRAIKLLTMVRNVIEGSDSGDERITLG